MDLAIENVKVGSANTAGGNLDQKVRSRWGDKRPLDGMEWTSWTVELHRDGVVGHKSCC